MIETETVATGAFPSVWYTIGPPNGCQPKHTERRVAHVEVYRADYYGRGAKLYARGYSTLEFPDGRSNGVPFSSWSDGHPDRVAGWLEKIGAQAQEG